MSSIMSGKLVLESASYRRLILIAIFQLFFTTYQANFRISSNNCVTAQSLSKNTVIKPVVLVVAPPVFNSALQPWISYRQSQGYDVFLLPLAYVAEDGSISWEIQTKPAASPDEIRLKILKVAEKRKIAAIVLVGDGAPTLEAKYGWRDVVPAARVSASVLPILGGEDMLATDSFYADLDSDGFADVPVGRFPVENPEELETLVKKILRYETSSPMGNWVRKINIVAGPNGIDLRVIGTRPGEELGSENPFSGVSAFVDSVINNMARKMFSEYLPPEFSLSLTQGSIQSVFCPYPPDFGNVFLQRMNEGSLFTVYMGHGRVLGLDRFEGKDRDYGIFEIDDCQELNNPFKSPIALFFACYTGAYDANCASLAEKIALSPNGPAAVLAASRLTAPYGMCVYGSSLLEVAFASDFSGVEDEPKLLGDIILQAQKKALAPSSSIEEQTSDGNSDGGLDQALLFENAEEQENNEEETTADEDDVTDLDDVFEDDLGQENSKTEPNVESDDVGLVLEEEGNKEESNEIVPGERLEKLNQRLRKSLDIADEQKRRNSFRVVLDRSAAIFDPTASRLDEQIKEHILEFNLFGDPLLRVKLPQRIEIETPDIVYSTKEVEISGVVPNLNDRESVVQAELLLADFRSPVKKRKRPRIFVESEETKADFRDVYPRANNFVVDAVRTTTKHGRFQAKILIPADFSGESVVRIAAFDGTHYYIGAKRLLVRPFTERTIKE